MRPLLLVLVASGCASEARLACEDWVEAVQACHADAGRSDPAELRTEDCAGASEDAETYACLATAYDEGDCGVGSEAALAVALAACGG